MVTPNMSIEANEFSATNEQLAVLLAGQLAQLPTDARGGRLWDGADQLLLETFLVQTAHRALSASNGGEALLLMNDENGALVHMLTNASVVSRELLKILRVESFSDDVRVAEMCSLVGESYPWVSFVPSTNQPGSPTIVMLRISPVEAILRAQIMLLLKMQSRGQRFLVIAGGLDRLLPSKSKPLLKLLGPTQTLPGAHKSHAFLCHVGHPLQTHPFGRNASNAGRSTVDHTPCPDRNESGDWTSVDDQNSSEDQMWVEAAGKILSFESGPYSFSAGRLDLGSRLLIEAVAKSISFGRTDEGQPGRVADLACGNGVVGVMAHALHKPRYTYFSDVSFSAIALTQRNAIRHGIENAEFAVDTGFDHYRGPRFDAVLLNPPFHHHGGVDEELGAQLFTSAHRQLRVGGELWVVGNRHLGYQKTLQAMFGHCRLVTAHPKFVVLAATRGATRLRTNHEIRRAGVQQAKTTGVRSSVRSRSREPKKE